MHGKFKVLNPLSSHQSLEAASASAFWPCCWLSLASSTSDVRNLRLSFNSNIVMPGGPFTVGIVPRRPNGPTRVCSLTADAYTNRISDGFVRLHLVCGKRFFDEFLSFSSLQAASTVSKFFLLCVAVLFLLRKHVQLGAATAKLPQDLHHRCCRYLFLSSCFPARKKCQRALDSRIALYHVPCWGSSVPVVSMSLAISVCFFLFLFFNASLPL
jgi:hypothetical protein